MAQSPSKVDETDVDAYLEEYPVFRLCRARRHRWPDPVTSVRDISGTWDRVLDAEPGEPNAILTVECERRCGCTLIKLGMADLKAQTFEVVDVRLVYPDDYLVKGTRIVPAQAEASLALSHFRLLAERDKPRKAPAAQAKKGSRRLRAVV